MIKKISEIANRSELSKRLMTSISWSLIGSILGKGLMLLSFILIARIIGKEQYGQLGIIRSTVNMFLVFSSMGMGLTASRYIAIHRNSDLNKISQINIVSNRISFFFGLFIFILIFIFSPYISKVSFGNLELSIPLRLSAIVLFFTTITSAQNGVLNGFEDFKSIGIITIKQSIFQGVIIIFGAYFYGLNGVIVCLGFSSIYLFLLFRYSIYKKLSGIKFDFSSKLFDSEMKDIFLKFTLPAVLAGLVSLPVYWWTKTVLIKQSNFGEMAIFDVSEQWNIIFQFIPGSISAIMLPMLTNILIEGTNTQYKKLIKFNLILNVGITLILAIFAIPLSPLILGLYGKTFTNFLPLQIMIFVAVLQVANSVLGQVIASKGRMWLGFTVNLIWGFWLIIFTLIFVVHFGMGSLGLAYAMLASYFLHSILQTFIAFKI